MNVASNPKIVKKTLYCEKGIIRELSKIDFFNFLILITRYILYLHVWIRIRITNTDPEGS